MADFTDWLARNFFITADQEQTAADVAAAQQSILDRQRDEGKVGAAKYLQLSSEIKDTGAQFFDEQLGKKGVPGLVATVPWWVWAAIVAGALIWFWPILRPLAGKLSKRIT